MADKPLPRVSLVACLSVDYDLAFLPHFLNYYGPLVDTAALVLHTVAGMQREADTAIASIKDCWPDAFIDYWHGVFRDPVKMGFLSDYVTHFARVDPESYLVYVDIDEQAQFPSPPKQIATPGVVYVGVMRDRWASQDRNDLPAVASDRPLEEQFPFMDDFTKQHGACVTRPVLFPARMGNSRALLHHPHIVSYPQNVQKVVGRRIPLDHYKWTERRKQKFNDRIDHWTHYQESGLAKYETPEVQSLLDSLDSGDPDH